MQTKHLLRLLAGATLALTLPKVSGQTPSNSDAFPVFDNYIKLGGQSDWISGDTNAFQARTKQAKDTSGGVQDFLYSKDLTKDTTLRIDGHALDNTEDYLAHFNVTKDRVGSVDVGYQRFRTFYDGVGGFFPGNNEWLPLSQQDLFTDRSKFWAEATINLPNAPIFKIRYTNEIRDGKKDSTEWGATDLTGINPATPPISPVRHIVPGYLQMDEHHQTLEASMKQTVGKTTYQLTALADLVNNMDGQFVTLDPTEVKNYTAQPGGINQANLSNQQLQTEYNGFDTKTFSLTGTTRTELTDKITMRTGLNFSDVAGTFSGDRQEITTTPTATGTAGSLNVVAVPVSQPVTTYVFTNLAGTSGVIAYAANLAFDFKPTDNFSATVALKGEDRTTKAAGTYNVISATGTPAITIGSPSPRAEFSHVDEKALTPELDLRYTGFNDVALYASATGVYSTGSDRNAPQYGTATVASPLQYFVTPSQSNGDYTVGATWRQSSLLNLRAETFYKSNSNSENGYNTTANSAVLVLGDNYILASQFSGIKLTAIAKPLDTLTFTTRYIFQRGTMEVTGSGATLEYDSMHSKSHSIGETIDWTPIRQLYIEANANLVFNVIDTIYPNAGYGPASGVNYNVNGEIQNSNNNYFTGSLLAGAVVTTTDDLQVQFNYYRASNGDAQLALLNEPYGVVATEYSASVGVKHKFSQKLIGNAKAGYYSSVNDTTGGKTNFHGPQAYVSLEYGF